MKRIGMALALLIAGARVSVDTFQDDPLWLWVHPDHVQAGNKKCDMSTEGPACKMPTCTSYGSDGKPNGMRCKRGYCKKECCLCPNTGPEACSLHTEEPDPEQGQ